MRLLSFIYPLTSIQEPQRSPHAVAGSVTPTVEIIWLLGSEQSSEISKQEGRHRGHMGAPEESLRPMNLEEKEERTGQ